MPFLSVKKEWFWFSGLLAAAVFIFGIDLGEVPLRDWDEGIVAQVAREIWRSPEGLSSWIYPKIGDGPYFNKPPLVHSSIALTYSFAPVNEWTTRFPPAMLAALAVPFLYGIGREIFPHRSSAILAALVYLTLLPAVRHGRLAMLDGAVVSFYLLMLWFVLRARKNPRASLGAGIGLGLICLTKGIMLGLLLGAIAVLFLFWDAPQLLRSPYFWIGILVGIVPALAWYLLQYLRYGQQFISVNLVDQSANRIWTSLGNHVGQIWYYLLEILKYSWPWLPFSLGGLHSAWKNRPQSWAKLVLVGSGFYLAAISLMATKLPWYVLPVYPALALAAGARLGPIWQGQIRCHLPLESVILAISAILLWIGSIYFGFFALEADLQLVLGATASTLTLATVTLLRHSRHFIVIFVAGMYLSLLLFFHSDHWVWELGEAYPVKPVAASIKRATIPSQIIYTSYPYYRPSLNFYSDRTVIPLRENELKTRWLEGESPHLLIEPSLVESLQLNGVKVLATADGWLLITRDDFHETSGLGKKRYNSIATPMTVWDRQAEPEKREKVC